MRPGRVPGSAPLACTGRAPWNLPAGRPEGPVFKGLRGGIHQLATATGNDYIRPNGKRKMEFPGFLNQAVAILWPDTGVCGRARVEAERAFC